MMFLFITAGDRINRLKEAAVQRENIKCGDIEILN